MTRRRDDDNAIRTDIIDDGMVTRVKEPKSLSNRGEADFMAPKHKGNAAEPWQAFIDVEQSFSLPHLREAFSGRTALLLSHFCKLAADFGRDQDLEPLEDTHHAEVKLWDKLASAQFDLVRAFQGDKIHGFVAAGPEFSVLVLSAPEDAVFGGREGQIGGIRDTYLGLERTIGDAVDQLGGAALYVTGHGIGGAYAALAVSTFASASVSACYTFGTPFNLISALDLTPVKTPIYRLVTSDDVQAGTPFTAMRSSLATDDVYYLMDAGRMTRNPDPYPVTIARQGEAAGEGKALPNDGHSIGHYIERLVDIVSARATLPG